MNNSIRTSEVLNKAADLIEERGWKQAGGDGDPWGFAGGSICLEGGIIAAMGLSADDFGLPPTGFSSCPAYAAMQAHLGMNEVDHIFHWNDAPERTASEVIEVLRAAALIEAAREDAARIVPGPVVPAPVEDETSVSA